MFFSTSNSGGGGFFFQYHFYLNNYMDYLIIRNCKQSQNTLISFRNVTWYWKMYLLTERLKMANPCKLNKTPNAQKIIEVSSNFRIYELCFSTNLILKSQFVRFKKSFIRSECKLVSYFMTKTCIKNMLVAADTHLKERGCNFR